MPYKYHTIDKAESLPGLLWPRGPYGGGGGHVWADTSQSPKTGDGGHFWLLGGITLLEGICHVTDPTAGWGWQRFAASPPSLEDSSLKTGMVKKGFREECALHRCAGLPGREQDANRARTADSWLGRGSKE